MTAQSGTTLGPPLPIGEQVVVDGFVSILQALLADRDVRADSHVFEDLGANSLTMTHFCARVRKHPELPAVSIRDVYKNPRVRDLAAAVAPVAPLVDPDPHLTSDPTPDLAPVLGAGGPAGSSPTATATATATAVTARPVAPEVALETVTAPASGASHALATVLQGLAFVLFSYLITTIGLRGYAWITSGSGAIDVYLRAVLAGGGGYVATCLLPVIAKWVLIGRWTRRDIPLWSVAYVRFWIVKSLLHSSPMILFVGSPVYTAYLRLLGADIGRGVTILTRSVPVATDLLTIGDGAIIRKDCFLLGYRAHAGAIQVGSVTLGAGAFVGEKTVLDIDTVVGVESQLGHSSSLDRGAQVPDGEHWHGCPAEPTHLDYQRVERLPDRAVRRFAFGLAGVLQTLLVYVPLGSAGMFLLLRFAENLGASAGLNTATLSGLAIEALVFSLFLLLVLFPVAMLLMFTLPRLFDTMIVPERVYPLYGLQFSLHRAVTMLTNRKMLTWLFGDSSYIVPYLRGLGYDLSTVEQTGSNFGTEVQHETPLHVTVGSGTMVADGLSILNAEYSATSFKVSRVTLGGHSFLGNNIAYPAGARIGENCLLATKVMVPLDGPIREGVGLLGSPSFEIPRTVERDSTFDHFLEGPEFDRGLRAKNRVNLRSMALMLTSRWFALFLVSGLAYLLLDTGLGGVWGQLAIAAFAPLTLALNAGWFILCERVILRFGRLEPKLCSIYDPYFWWHERLWKVPDFYLNLFNGTALKPLVWRLLGVRIGKRVFDDGAYLTERTLSAIGDDAILNVNSKLQAHSQEDGTFKSDHIVIGAGATLSVGAFVHYGTTVGAGAVIGTDAFLMKGEDVPERTRWVGNPAVSVTTERDTSSSTEPTTEPPTERAASGSTLAPTS